MKRSIFICIVFFVISLFPTELFGQSQNVIFDDKMLLEGYAKKYAEEPKEILLEMIKDDTLTSYRSSAAIRVFRERFSQGLFTQERRAIERILLRRLNHTDSSFVEIEAMHTLCLMDRYRYFGALIPDLIQKLDHYNTLVNEMASHALNDIIITKGHNRRREARIVFNTLRKTFFLSRKKLQKIKEPTPKLKQKLGLLKWSIKILGSQELKKLPSEVISLL